MHLCVLRKIECINIQLRSSAGKKECLWILKMTGLNICSKNKVTLCRETCNFERQPHSRGNKSVCRKRLNMSRDLKLRSGQKSNLNKAVRATQPVYHCVWSTKRPKYSTSRSLIRPLTDLGLLLCCDEKCVSFTVVAAVIGHFVSISSL